MIDILQRILAGPTANISGQSLEGWLADRPARWRRWGAAIDVAIEGGFAADRLGFAFIAAFDSALRAMVPTLARDGSVAAFCASETGGAHPRAIEARLEQNADGRWRVDGKKRWITGGGLAQTLLVVASTGMDPARRNRLRVARVDANAQGVAIQPMATPFIPEIPHAEVTFCDVAVEELLPGDGYDDFLKPFRTIEDLYVHAGLLGYLMSVARRSAAPQKLLEALALNIVATRALAASDPKAPQVHVALAGLQTDATRLVAEIEPLWSRLDQQERERWQRDQPLLQVAAKAREARRGRAWELLGQQE